MRKYISLFLVLSLVLVSSGPILAADHTASNEIGEIAGAAGNAFVAGAKQVAEPFIVVGKTVVAGAAFVILKGEQGVIWVAEETIHGAKYLVAGAKFVLIKTAQGIRWVAVQAIVAAEIVFDTALAVTILAIEGVEYVLLALEDGFVYVARKAIEAGKVVIRGVKYVVKKTAEGVLWVTEHTWNALKAGASWARDRVIATKVRTRLAAALVSGSVNADALQYFQDLSVNASASPMLRRLSGAAYAASRAFVDTYRP